MGHAYMVKTKREVIDIVRRTAKKKKEKEGEDFEKCKFNGEGWWNGFVQRHPKLSLRTANSLSYCRSIAVDQESIDYYFSLLKKALRLEANRLEKRGKREEEKGS